MRSEPLVSVRTMTVFSPSMSVTTIGLARIPMQMPTARVMSRKAALRMDEVYARFSGDLSVCHYVEETFKTKPQQVAGDAL